MAIKPTSFDHSSSTPQATAARGPTRSALATASRPLKKASFIVDLTKEHPRSPNTMMAGILSLARMTDKAHAYNDKMLGDYDVDCPHDKPVLEILGISFETFANKIEELKYDDSAIEAWARRLLVKRTPEEIAAFKESRRNWKPDEHSIGYFEKMRDEVAPGRTDITTWFALLDADEGRVAA